MCVVLEHIGVLHPDELHFNEPPARVRRGTEITEITGCWRTSPTVNAYQPLKYHIYSHFSNRTALIIKNVYKRLKAFAVLKAFTIRGLYMGKINPTVSIDLPEHNIPV